MFVHYKWDMHWLMKWMYCSFVILILIDGFVTFGKLHAEVDMFICVKNSISRTIDEIEHIARHPKLNSQWIWCLLHWLPSIITAQPSNYWFDFACTWTSQVNYKWFRLNYSTLNMISIILNILIWIFFSWINKYYLYWNWIRSINQSYWSCLSRNALWNCMN